ncbi:MAG TPA: hypothetical protein VIL69_17525 [Roseomonas sp.]|jgi:hypothetical protein
MSFLQDITVAAGVAMSLAAPSQARAEVTFTFKGASSAAAQLDGLEGLFLAVSCAMPIAAESSL